MEIQWSLVFFTALTGTAGWMTVCIAVDEIIHKAPKIAFRASLVAFIVAAVGGLLSITHLSHPGRVLNALQHPTSGIFIEIVLTAGLCLFLLILIILVARKAPKGARATIAVIAALFGIALSFMSGDSYMMESRANWDTILLPIGYMCTAIPAGVSLYLLMAGTSKDDAEKKGVAPYVICLIIGGCLGLVFGLVYIIYAGFTSGAVIALTFVVGIGSGIVPIICGILLRSRPASMLTLSIVSLACALIGAICFRCIMWLITVPVADLFGIVV